MIEKVLEQIKLLFAQKICDDMRTQMQEQTNKFCEKLGINADVTIEIKCNSVDFEQLGKGIKDMQQENADANSENPDFGEKLKIYKE